MMDEMGGCTGKVWRHLEEHLEEHRDSTLEEMTKALTLKESVAWMALGCLAREDISSVLTLRDQAVSMRNIPLSVADQLRDTVQSPQQAMDPGSTTPRSESRSTKASRSIYSGSTEELDLIAALRSGDELAFTQLVGTCQNRLLRTARTYVSSEAEAEEVVQETWLGVLKGLERFEGRCSLKTWIFQILINRARTRGKREARMIPFSVVFDRQTDAGAPAVDPSPFNNNGPES